jgi:Uma2 family endonuclease
MATLLRWTSSDLGALPDDGKRYEIIDGELYMSGQPHFIHQRVCSDVNRALGNWSEDAGRGVAVAAPGVIFGEEDDVAPDVVWASHERLREVLGADGKLHSAPELVVEVLSPGSRNELRDRDVKLKLYSRRGVSEYWLVDWSTRRFDVYRQDDGALRLVETLMGTGSVRSPLLPGFALDIAKLFH